MSSKAFFVLIGRPQLRVWPSPERVVVVMAFEGCAQERISFWNPETDGGSYGFYVVDVWCLCGADMVSMVCSVCVVLVRFYFFLIFSIFYDFCMVSIVSCFFRFYGKLYVFSFHCVKDFHVISI